MRPEYMATVLYDYPELTKKVWIDDGSYRWRRKVGDTIPTPAWTELRPWRNNNPGDLRPMAHDVWSGQTGIDPSPGGPFCVFADRTHGWRALGKLLMAYVLYDGCNNLGKIVHRFAPGEDNNNEVAYVGILETHLNLMHDEEITPEMIRDFDFLDGLCIGVSVAEAGARIVWPVDEREEGLRLALTSE